MDTHLFRRAPLLLFGLSAFAFAACEVSAEVEVPDIEVTQRGINFDAAPPSLSGFVFAISQSFEFTPASLPWAKDLNANVHVMKISLQPAQGVSNLDFIHVANMTVSSVAGPVGSVELMRFERAAGTPAGPGVDYTPVPPIDVTQLWSSKRMRVDITAVGELPDHAWSLDSTIRLSGHIAYKS